MARVLLFDTLDMSDTPALRSLDAEGGAFDLPGSRAALTPGDAVTTDELPALSGLVSRAERYVLGAKLGQGGTSVVYEAHDLLLDRIVALKQLHSDNDPSGRALLQEAKALAAVDHPSVVRVLSVEAEAQPPLLVMERVRGRSLASLLADGRMPIAHGLAIAKQVAGGIDALHAAGVVHGDVKPANVIVDDVGRAKLVDVGLAPLLARMKLGQVLGTASYMPPERALGAETAPGLVPRGDVYSFGVLCFELLTGRLPFIEPSRAELLRAHALHRPPMPSYVAGLSTELDAPIARALDKRADRRHATCTELAEELERASLGCDASGRRLRVLVADDDHDQQTLLMSILGTYLPGASIVLCGTGQDALDCVRGQGMSIALLDLAMPDPCGIELVRQMRALSPSTPIVIVTGAGSGLERAGARRLGVRHFIVKPFDLTEIVDAIRGALVQSEATRTGPRAAFAR